MSDSVKKLYEFNGSTYRASDASDIKELIKAIYAYNSGYVAGIDAKYDEKTGAEILSLKPGVTIDSLVDKVQTTITDGQGSAVRILRDNKAGEGSAEFKDTTGDVQYTSTAAGFTGHEEVLINGNPVMRAIKAEVIDGKGNVKCEGRDKGLPLSLLHGADNVNTSDRIVEAVARERIAAFLQLHPDIDYAIKYDPDSASVNGTEITTLKGQPASLADLGRYPSQFIACPAGSNNVIIERISRDN